MKYTDDFHDRLKHDLAEKDSVATQLYERIKELELSHRNDAVSSGDTDFAKGKLAAFRMLREEIESVNNVTLIMGG